MTFAYKLGGTVYKQKLALIKLFGATRQGGNSEGGFCLEKKKKKKRSEDSE